MVSDFNAEDSEKTLCNFLEKHDAATIFKEKTCFKSLNNLSCIDLLITNRRRCLQNTNAFSTGLSHFHKTVVNVLNTSFSKAPLKDLFHRDYTKFEQDKFKYELKRRFENESIECYSNFQEVLVNIVNEHVPLQKEILKS